MGTRFSSAFHPSISTLFEFQGIAQFIEDTLVTTGGWVVTTDSGQTLPSALTLPSAGSQKMGYRVYRMNDALQSTAPVFMKLHFGSSGFGTAILGLWVTIGQGSDGAGNITNILFNGGAVAGCTVGNGSGNYSNIGQASNCYGSAAPNRFSFALYIQGVANGAPIIFCLERSKDANGNDTTDGLIMIFVGGQNAQGVVDSSVYIKSPPTTQANVESMLNYVLTTRNPSETFGGDIGIGLIIPMRGLAQQPGINLVTINSSDVGVEGSFASVIYGTAHSYQQCNAFSPRKVLITNSPSGGQDSNARVAILYE